MKKFINRENELKELNQKWASKTPQLFVLYGKRRVGKTELIKQFIKNKPSVYFMGDKRTTRDQLLEVGRLLGSFFKDVFIARNGSGLDSSCSQRETVRSEIPRNWANFSCVRFNFFSRSSLIYLPLILFSSCVNMCFHLLF